MCFKIHFKLNDKLDKDDLVFFIIIVILEIAQIKAQGLRLFRKTHFEWYLDSLFTKLISNYLKPIKGQSGFDLSRCPSLRLPEVFSYVTPAFFVVSADCTVGSACVSYYISVNEAFPESRQPSPSLLF